MRVPPVAVVNQIRQNLHDRYGDGFDIIKELIQNAEDAGACRFDIGWHRGISHAHHPLLRGPLLFVVNNGRFNDHDSYAIDTIGLSSKENNQAIGKFGLGLKSVFHLCEAFFYMASPQPDLETEKRQGIVNPWADDQGHDRFHDDWDAFPTSDHEYLRRILAPVLDSSRYLCLWLPLRKDTESDSPIMTNYPGKFKTAPELLPPELPINMAQLLPLLRSIQNVRGWYPIGNGIQRCFNIWQSGRGLRDPDKIPADKPLALEGKVQIKPDQLGFLQYAGQEILLDEEPHFANLRCSDKWPSYSITDPETGEYRPERESVQPHAAICFTRKLATSKQACLSIHQAVFLPLDVPDDPFESVRCNGGDFDYSLTLHGCYFVDPGRSGVDGWDQGIQTSQPGSEAELRLEWNGRLAQEGMFPLLIQALEQFVDSCELSEEDQETLTSALAMSQFFQQYRKVICSKHQWVCMVTPEGKRWKLLSTDEIIYPLLMPPKSDPKRPFSIFNNLNKVHHLTFSELSCLTARQLSNQWPDDELCSILQEVAVNQVFTSRGYLDYLLKFLDSAMGKPPTESPDVSRVLLQLARQVLQIPLSNLSKVRSHIQRFIAFIPAEHRFPLSIDTNSDAAAALFSPLTKLPIDVLLVPSELDYSETPGDATLEMQDALRLLEELNMLSEEQEQRPDIQPLKSQLAIQIISAVTDRDLLLRRCRSLALFEGYDCSSGKNVLFSLKTLEELVGCNTLFRYGSAKPNDLVHARLLQRALDSAWVVVINKELADFLPSTVTSCDSDACMQILRMHPPLGKAEQRKGLLEVLVSSVDSFISEEQRRSLRYLLHAQPNADYENHFPLFAGGEDVDSVLIKLMKSALGLLGSGWRMVPNLLANVLTPVQRHLLRVRRITKVEVVGLLKQVDMTRLGLTFDEDEADTILREVTAPDILRALPIHQTLDGRRVAIGESIYRSGGLELRGPLGDRITLICSHSDPVLAAKQATIIPPLTPSGIIDLALRQDEPYRYWREVMDALERLDGLPTLGLSLRDTLRTTGWIPTSLERHVSLANVIHIGGLEIFIQRVVAPHSDQYMGIDALLPDVRNHPGFRRLVKLLPRKTVALAQLAKLMATDVCYHLGRVIDTTADLDEKQLGDILFAFQAQSDLLPAWEIIRAAREQAQVSFADCMEHLLPPLQRELSDEKTVEVLRFLANRHKSAPNKDKKRLLRVSHIYLKTAAAKPNFQKAILPCLEFLNKHEAWLRTSELAFNTHGIAPEHLLHPEQEQLLAAHKPTPLNQMADSATTSGDFVHGRQEAIEASADALEAFFATWKGRVNDEVIGGFLSLLGDDPAIIKLAQGYLGNRTLAPTRDLIGWKALPRSAPTGGIIGGGGEDIHQIMTWQRFVVEIEDQEETIELSSLLGTLFTARRLPQSDLSHLFIGDRPIIKGRRRHGNQIYRIRLARITPADCTPQQLSSLLRESARQLLRKVYSQSGLDLDAAWDELEQSEQLDIQLAQRLLLDSSFFYLKQLGVHTHRPLGPLGEVLRRWEDARRLRAEEEQTQKLGRKIKITAQQEPDKTRSELADLLENDLDTQTLILGAVRRKVCDYQYNPQSIPFELFQNADDAAEELAAMSGSELPADSTTFAIEWDKQQITFIHWGRLVNQHRLGSFENGRKLGYDRDLEKMLVLSYSDKSVDQTTVVTGKFGLGFKSVFLVSATPLLLSGRLGVQITAGMYPQYLQPETLQLLRNKASAASSSNDSSAQATLVQLPLDEDQDPDRILEDMVSMAHVILVFARRIKCCRLGGNTLRWQEEAFKDTKSVFYGRLQPAVGSQHQAARALVLRSQAGPGALLLVLDKEGVSSLDSSVPTMWVTAPTRHRLNLGFALNGPFELDVGRAQLAAAAPANAKLACQIGRDLGQALSELYVACRDWPEARLVLGLEANVTPYRFWDSLWQRLGPPLAVASSLSERTTSYGESSKNPALDYKIWASKPFLRQAASVGNDAPITLLRNMLWDSNEVAAGMTRLIRDHAALPTGLWGDYQCLTTLNRVRYVISGFLDKSEEAFGIAIRWVSSYDGVSKDSLISSERVWRHLRGLSPDIKQITILDLPAIVRREIGRRDRVSPEIAGRLGALITRERLQEIERERHPEHRLLVEFLRTLRFGAHNGHFSPATELLIGQGESKEQEDERARAAFAPEGRVLGPDYGAIARQFFLACRGPLRAPAEELARWALDVTPTQRNAVLRYVLGGELSIELAESLRSHPNFASSWLAQLNRDSDLLTAFDGNERGIILGRLGLFTAAPPFRSPLPRLDPVAALEKVYCWWQAHKEQLTRQYDEKIYPNGARLVCSDTFDPQSQEDRTQWLTLFLLGSFFTMGRTRPEQHRGFIQQCQEKGWLAVFAAPTMQADNWIDILDQYMDDQSAESTYYQWMKHFISIYQLSRWLPEYVDSFLAIQRFNDAFSLDQITRSRTSPAFQRGGPDAPPVMRPLGIGACFVVRELVRARVLTSHHAFPHCFVPTRQVREMMIQLGCQLDLDSRSADNSRVIYDFLTEKLGEERATLQQSFDIPFYYIAQKWSGSVAEFLRAQG